MIRFRRISLEEAQLLRKGEKVWFFDKEKDVIRGTITRIHIRGDVINVSVNRKPHEYWAVRVPYCDQCEFEFDAKNYWGTSCLEEEKEGEMYPVVPQHTCPAVYPNISEQVVEFDDWLKLHGPIEKIEFVADKSGFNCMLRGRLGNYYISEISMADVVSFIRGKLSNENTPQVPS